MAEYSTTPVGEASTRLEDTESRMALKDLVASSDEDEPRSKLLERLIVSSEEDYILSKLSLKQKIIARPTRQSLEVEARSTAIPAAYTATQLSPSSCESGEVRTPAKEFSAETLIESTSQKYNEPRARSTRATRRGLQFHFNGGRYKLRTPSSFTDLISISIKSYPKTCTKVHSGACN